MPAAPEFGVSVAPEGFALSSDVAEVAAAIIDRHPSLHDLRHVRIAYLLNWRKMPKDAKGIHAIAKAHKAPDLWGLLSAYDAAVWVNGEVWQAMSPRQREAVLLHEHLHFLVDPDTEALRVVKHDVEEFAQVVAEYGPWHGGLDHFAEQLRLWPAAAAEPWVPGLGEGPMADDQDGDG